jgi:hypothetical protein
MTRDPLPTNGNMTFKRNNKLNNGTASCHWY